LNCFKRLSYNLEVRAQLICLCKSIINYYDAYMEQELIDGDPLSKPFFRVTSNYKTAKYKLKLCVPKLPIYKNGDFIPLGSKELVNEHVGNCYDGTSNYHSGKAFGNDLEVYTKREWLINWCEEEIKNGHGWYLLRQVAPILLRELKNGNKYIYFFDLVR